MGCNTGTTLAARVARAVAHLWEVAESDPAREIAAGWQSLSREQRQPIY